MFNEWLQINKKNNNDCRFVDDCCRAMFFFFSFRSVPKIKIREKKEKHSQFQLIWLLFGMKHFYRCWFSFVHDKFFFHQFWTMIKSSNSHIRFYSLFVFFSLSIPGKYGIFCCYFVLIFLLSSMFTCLPKYTQKFWICCKVFMFSFGML